MFWRTLSGPKWRRRGRNPTGWCDITLCILPRGRLRRKAFAAPLARCRLLEDRTCLQRRHSGAGNALCHIVLTDRRVKIPFQVCPSLERIKSVRSLELGICRDKVRQAAFPIVLLCHVVTRHVLLKIIVAKRALGCFSGTHLRNPRGVPRSGLRSESYRFPVPIEPDPDHAGGGKASRFQFFVLPEGADEQPKQRERL